MRSERILLGIKAKPMHKAVYKSRGSMENEVLTAGEEQIMKTTFKATMLRCAAIIDRITNDDVYEAQLEMSKQGVVLADLAKIDRAAIASAHIRACAELSEGGL